MKHVKSLCADDYRAVARAQTSPGLPSVRLTVKEQEALEWAAKGKSAWEIARIQGCSESAINFHMCNIRRKFGVSSLRAALVMAIMQGLILVR